MPFCPNCGNRVKAVYHYCGSCGQAMSEVAESEYDSPIAVERDGFLSLRSLSYVNELLAGEREVDDESVSYRNLSREVSTAFADFARLSLVKDLDLLHLWAAGSNSDGLRKSVEDMNSDQLENWLAVMGLGRTLQMYDDALRTQFEDEFGDRLQTIIEFVNEEIDDEDLPD